MKKYLDYLLIDNLIFDENILSNSLFISIDDISALRKDYNDVLSKIKLYDSYTIVKSDIRSLHEGYEQGLFIIKLFDKDIFVRLILSDKLIYDTLIYTIKDMNLINRVFFNKKEIAIPGNFKAMLDTDKAVVILNKEGSNYRILKANAKFYEYIKYEDWDFANKYQNIINQKAVDIIDLSSLKLYQSDKGIIVLENNVYNNDDIYCLVEK